MFDVIKTLTPKQRIWAFIIAVIFSSITAIGTVYFKSDDCTDISKQYDSMMITYTNQLSLNNKIMEDSNKKTNDIIEVKRLLDSMLSIKPKCINQTVVIKEIQPIRLTTVSSDSVEVFSNIKKEKSLIKVMKIELPVNQKPIIKKISKILDKYKDTVK